MSPKRYDVAVVGGGPAGLCAGLWLARYLHTVVVIDSGDPRNWETRGINGYLGHQGIRAPELRAIGREECTKYGVDFVTGVVDTAVNETGELFAACLRDGTTIEANRILLAIGIKDYWPDIAGLERCYGETVHVCPDCDGYETRDKKTIVVGSGRKAVGLALALATWTSKIVICTNGEKPDMNQALLDKLKVLNIPVLEAPIQRAVSEASEIVGIELEGAMSLDCERLYFARLQRFDLICELLGARLVTGGHILQRDDLRRAEAGDPPEHPLAADRGRRSALHLLDPARGRANLRLSGLVRKDRVAKC